MAGMNVDVRSLQQHKPLDLSKLSKQKRDWLEVFGNQWKAKQAMPGTCEACVWGRGEHADGCVLYSVSPEMVAAAANGAADLFRPAPTAEDMALFKRLSGVYF